MRFFIRFLWLCLTWMPLSSLQAGDGGSTRPVLGMYVLQQWVYNHPYAARTWTLEDWRGYLDGLHKLGFNMVLIWPMLETMPNPLTPSDEANLAKIAKVIEMGHRDFGMKVNLVLCPNVAAKDEVASRYTFTERPFFLTDRRVDPGDPVAFGQLMAWREKLLRPLAAADGLFIIDSDPGGYPNSTNLEFVSILGAHRRVLDRLRPGIEVYYWAHAGWEAYGKYYATGTFRRGERDEIQDAIKLLSRQHYEPWGVAMRFGDIGDSLGLGDHVLGFPYGMIEGEPSFPLTLFGGTRPIEGGQTKGPRGVLGNAQTHCVQLPNTFAFARSAQGLTATKADFVAFANRLIVGQGETIVEGWEALQGEDALRMRKAATALEGLAASPFQLGDLQGLLFGDAKRFLNDLVLQLQMIGALRDLRSSIQEPQPDRARTSGALAAFIQRLETWQKTHGYQDIVRLQPLDTTLALLKSPHMVELAQSLDIEKVAGATAFERVANRLAQRRDYTLRLIVALKRTEADLRDGKLLFPAPVGKGAKKKAADTE